MKNKTALILLTTAVLSMGLSACGSGESSKAQGGQAQGEILPGSVSDEMIPLDQVKSQAPLAPKGDGGDKPGSKADSSEKSADK